MIGLLELRRRKLQFGLIGAVMALIAYLLLAINGLGAGLNYAAGGAVRSLDADAVAFANGSSLDFSRSQLSQSDVDAISATDGVEAAAPISFSRTDYKGSDGSTQATGFFGFLPGTIAAPEITAGRELTEDDRDAILADRSFLKDSGFNVGDKVTFTVDLQDREFEIVGEVDEGQYIFGPVVYMLQPTFTEFRYGANADRAPVANAVLLKGDGLAGRGGENFEIASKSAVLKKTLTGIRETVLLLQVFGYAIGAAVIGVFFYVLTIQKIGQIGVIKALGASNGYVFRQLLIQVVVIAVAGLAVAIPLGWLTGNVLDRAAATAPFEFSTSAFVQTSVALLVTAVVGALFCGRRIITTDPIISLGQQQS